MRVRTAKTKGFTLIEVTLAIVIGIIMIAGATLIYNQAKTSAGNSRAQAKVVALQALVEEYAAQNQGVYPSNLSDVNALWKRKRPDDWNKSPWGGVIGISYNPTLSIGEQTAYGVGNNSNGAVQFPSTTIVTARRVGDGASPVTGNIGTSACRGIQTTCAQAQGDANYVGGLFYDFDSGNYQFAYPIDIMTNQTSLVKGYAVYVADQQGRYPNFVVGGRANQ